MRPAWLASRLVEQLAQSLTEFLAANNNPLGLLVLGGAALIEYVFPPFPGDTVTLFGGVLVFKNGWSLALVFAALMLGSALGALIDFGIGVSLASRYEAGGLSKRPKLRARLDGLLVSIREWGPAYVAINRFLPGVRALIFVAAGMARLRTGPVLFFALVSAALWNGLILVLAYTLGANWERLKEILGQYGMVAWGITSVLVVAVVVFVLVRRRSRGSEPPAR